MLFLLFSPTFTFIQTHGIIVTNICSVSINALGGINMDKDFIWEAEYGHRTYLQPILKDLLNKQHAKSLQCLALYINNNPYNLEFFIVASYNHDDINDINYMKSQFTRAGLVYRQDLTMMELITQQQNRRFNSIALQDDNSVDLSNYLFAFDEIDNLEKKGYIMTPFGKEKEIFISHSSKDKPEVEKLLPLINALGLPVWFDKYNIDVGQSIIDKLQDGIKNSHAVIFWITHNFLESRWCKKELNAFIKRMVEEDILIISILDQHICVDELPIFLQDIKYIQRENESLEDIIKELLPTLKNFSNEMR